MWLGPPSSQMRMTRVSREGLPDSAAASLSRIRPGRPSEARPATPSCTKLRREYPECSKGQAPASTRSIATLLPGPAWPAPPTAFPAPDPFGCRLYYATHPARVGPNSEYGWDSHESREQRAEGNEQK